MSTPCEVCPELATRRAATGEVLICGRCGAVHGPDDLRWRREPTPPRALPLPAVAPPGGSRLLLGVLRAEDDELVTVRRLLCELRPDKGGPLGWGPYAEAPKVEPLDLGALARRIRVQTSIGPETTVAPVDAFASAATITAGTAAAERIRQLGGEASLTLEWLQRHGTLARGLGELYAAVGQALATSAQRERWKATRAAALDGPRVVGRRRVTEAARVWWGESDEGREAGGGAPVSNLP